MGEQLYAAWCMQTSYCHWHWGQTNLTYHFSLRYFNGIEIVTAFKCIFEETIPKLSVDFGNYFSQHSHKNRYLGSHLCKLRTFKKFFTAPWLKNLVKYSYLLPKYSVKISREKKMGVFFLFHFFCKRGILHVSLWRVAL